jgi:predicted secreted Zn-dependent protease
MHEAQNHHYEANFRAQKLEGSDQIRGLRAVAQCQRDKADVDEVEAKRAAKLCVAGVN